MFTGLIGSVGTVLSLADGGGGRDVTIEMPWTDLELGESIAVDGACLTVASIAPGQFTAHVVATTLVRTTFGRLAKGQLVNLERAMRLESRFGGHLVQGHVDGLGVVRSVGRDADAVLIEIAVPAEVADVSILLGSVTVNGVSLTINAIPEPGVIQVSIVPFTLEHTTLGNCSSGLEVHLEGDIVGKHIRALATRWNPETLEG